MEPFKSVTSVAVALDRMNVDTDAIVPKQFLKKIERTGFGQHLFHEWRFLDDDGKVPNPEFVLNQPRYQGAQILVARDNFGCGSSREHAPWALKDYGFVSIIAPSFADIFYNNCFKNGILPVTLSATEVDRLFKLIESNESYKLTVDLERQVVVTGDGEEIKFDIDQGRRERLLGGLDDIGWTLQYEDKISSFEQKQKGDSPWLYVN